MIHTVLFFEMSHESCNHGTHNHGKNSSRFPVLTPNRRFLLILWYLRSGNDVSPKKAFPFWIINVWDQTSIASEYSKPPYTKGRLTQLAHCLIARANPSIMIESPPPPTLKKAENIMENRSPSHPWRMVIVNFLGAVAITAALAAYVVSVSNSEIPFLDSIQERTTREKAVFEGAISPAIAELEAFPKEPETLALSERTTQKIRKYASSSTKLGSESSEGHSFGSESDKTKNNKKVLNVHVVPHTHDDVGWLKTVDQYYNGWNDTIQVVSVREILTSVVEALENNPSRTFTYAEIKFFFMWWKEQPESVRERVQKLVRETKQLTFINGGWCMHDEASTHYIGMIDQTALGHDFLKRTFDYIPTVGWQLDPFGHSSTQASLMTYKMGFDSLYFGRIDYQDLELRHATKECEGLWNAFSGETRLSDKNDEGSVFWGLTGSYGGNYGSPGGYW